MTAWRLLLPLTAALLLAHNPARGDDGSADALPNGAKLRFGTARLRTSFNFNPVELSPNAKDLVVGGGGSLIYVDPASGKTLKTVPIKGESGSIYCFSNDGSRAVGSGFRGGYVFDTSTGKVLNNLSQPIPFGMRRASLSGDGKRLAVGGVKTTLGGPKSDDNGPTATVWDVDSNKQIASVKPMQNQAVFVALSPDGMRLLTWGYHLEQNAKGPPDEATDPNRICQFWDANSGKELAKGLLTGSSNNACVAFSPDGSRVAVAVGDGAIQLFDPTTGSAVKLLLGRARQGKSLCFSLNGKILASCGEDGVVQQWSIPAGERLGTTEPPIPANYTAQGLRFANDTRVVVWGTHYNATIVWEAPSGKLLSPAGGHSSGISAIAALGEKELFTASSDGTIIAWDFSGKQGRTFQLNRPYTGFGSFVVTEPFALSPDGTLALANETSGSCGLGVYDVAKGSQQFLLPGDNRTNVGSFSLDGSKILQVQSSYDAKILPRVVVWDLRSAAKLGSVTIPRTTLNKVAAAVTPDGRTLLTAGTKETQKGPGDFTVTAWELATGNKLGEYSEAGAYGQFYVLPLSDNKSALVSTPKGGLLVVDVLAGKKLRELNSANAAPPVQPVLSPDMKSVAVPHQLSGDSAKIAIVDIESGKARQTLYGPTANITALAYSADGKKLYVGCSDTTVLVWELKGD